MGAAIASRAPPPTGTGLAWCDAVDLAGAAVNDLTTLKTLFDRVATSSTSTIPTVPHTALTNFRRAVDVYVVHHTPTAAAASALHHLGELLASRGLITSLPAEAAQPSPSSSSAEATDYRHGIENANLVLFFLTKPYIDRILAATAATSRDHRTLKEFQYIAARKSFLRLVPVLVGEDIDLSDEATTGPVGLLLGGRSNVIHWPVTPNAIADAARGHAATALYHTCVRAFVDNAQRAVKLQDMTRWMRQQTPGIHPAKWPGYALAFLDKCDCGDMRRLARRVVDDHTVLTDAGVGQYDQEELLAALLDEEVLPATYVAAQAERRRNFAVTGVLLEHVERRPTSAQRKVLDQRSALRTAVRAHRLKRDQELEGIYAEPSPLPVGIAGGAGGGGGMRRPMSAADARGSSSGSGSGVPRAPAASTVLVAPSSPPSSSSAFPSASSAVGGGGGGVAASGSDDTRTVRAVRQAKQEVEVAWRAKLRAAADAHAAEVVALRGDVRRLMQEAADRDVLLNALKDDNDSLQAELRRWRGARGVLQRHWDKQERRRQLLKQEHDDAERKARAREALQLPA